jgi:hypothetical protein
MVVNRCSRRRQHFSSRMPKCNQIIEMIVVTEEGRLIGGTGSTMVVKVVAMAITAMAAKVVEARGTEGMIEVVMIAAVKAIAIEGGEMRIEEEKVTTHVVDMKTTVVEGTNRAHEEMVTKAVVTAIPMELPCRGHQVGQHLATKPLDIVGLHRVRVIITPNPRLVSCMDLPIKVLRQLHIPTSFLKLDSLTLTRELHFPVVREGTPRDLHLPLMGTVTMTNTKVVTVLNSVILEEDDCFLVIYWHLLMSVS